MNVFVHRLQIYVHSRRIGISQKPFWVEAKANRSTSLPAWRSQAGLCYFIPIDLILNFSTEMWLQWRRSVRKYHNAEQILSGLTSTEKLYGAQTLSRRDAKLKGKGAKVFSREDENKSLTTKKREHKGIRVLLVHLVTSVPRSKDSLKAFSNFQFSI